VLVSGLPADVQEEEVKEVFRSAGFVAEVTLNRSKGTAEVAYASKSAVDTALKRLDSVGLRGHILQVQREGTTRGMPY